MACFREDPRVELVAVADNVPRLRQDGQTPVGFAASIGVRHYVDAAEMISSGTIDAVSLAVRPVHRLPLLRAAAARRMPVLMEKPMSASIEEALEIARIVKDSGIFFMMEYPMRYFPQLVELRRLIDQDVVGKVWAMTGDIQTPWNPPAGSWVWNASDGNGLLNEAIIHLYDTAHFICGRPKNVYAVGRNHMGHGELEDSGAAIVRFEGGSVATLHGGGLGAAAMAAEPLSLHVYGESGEALVTGRDWLYKTLIHASRKDKEPTVRNWEPPPRFQIMRYNLREFVGCVLDGRPTGCGLEAGLVAQGIVDAIKRSMASGMAEPVRSFEGLS